MEPNPSDPSNDRVVDLGSRGISFIVPCFNEQPEVLLKTVVRLREAASAAGWAHEIIVVDDASTACAYDAASLPGAALLRHRTNRGYGASLATGLRQAKFPWIGIVDADGTYPVERFAEMLRLTGDYQMIVG